MIYDVNNTMDRAPLTVISNGKEVKFVTSVDIMRGVIKSIKTDKDYSFIVNPIGFVLGERVIYSSDIQMIDKDGNVFAELKK